MFRRPAPNHLPNLRLTSYDSNERGLHLCEVPSGSPFCGSRGIRRILRRELQRSPYRPRSTWRDWFSPLSAAWCCVVVTRNDRDLLLNRRHLPKEDPRSQRRQNRRRHQKRPLRSRLRPHHHHRTRNQSMFHQDPRMSGLAARGNGAANGFGCPADGCCRPGPESYGFAGIGTDGMVAGFGCLVTGGTNGHFSTSSVDQLSIRQRPRAVIVSGVRHKVRCGYRVRLVSPPDAARARARSIFVSTSSGLSRSACS